MSSGRQSSDDSRRDSVHENRSPAASPDSLDRILDHTLNAAAAPGSIDPGDLAAFRDAARTHVGQPFSYEPVAVELVFAALCRQFEPRDSQTPALHAAAEQIAAALCDDPESRGRLEQLWGRLNKAPL
jgi:hypothetical protein